jgi:hypothetical protein
VIEQIRRLRQIVSYSSKIARTEGQRKHLIPWLRSLREGYLLDEPSPWFCFDAIEYLRGFIDRERVQAKTLRVFEYGSGGSTLFWQASGLECVSIEHDPQWFSSVHDRLDPSSVDHRLILPEPRETNADPDPSDPRAYASGDAKSRGYSFRRYVEAIDEFPDSHFDIVAIDGRARPSCIMHGAKKVRAGGLLILDNAEHEYYTRNTQEFVRNFRHNEFWGVLPMTMWFSRTDVHVRIG